MSLYVHGVWSNISPDKWTFIDKIVRTYAIFQSFEHLFWVLKRTVSLRRLFWASRKLFFDMIFKHIQRDT